MRRQFAPSLMALSLAVATFGCGDSSSAVDGRPNILLVVADDLGYAEIGPFGGEIDTPTLDALAASGIRLTNFHVLPTCSPTRSALLSGVDNHQAGLGSMFEALTTNQRGQPGYEGYLNDRVVSVASLLRDGGYHTYMAGKWHLGREADQSPAARGFEKSFAFLHGGGSHWNDMRGLTPDDSLAEYRENGELVEELPQDFYSSEFYANRLMQYIETDRGDDRPFFGYLSFTAPHDPLHAPDEWLAKYRGRYDAGYDELREQRVTRMRERGLISRDVTPFPGLPTIPAWEALSDSERAIEARKMEAYAAMVDNMDFHLGRVLDHLREIGEYENTIVVFLSDNGSNGLDMDSYPGQTADYLSSFDNTIDNIGRRGSFTAYGAAWAQAGMVPFRLYKATTAEGGIRSPFLASGPGVASGSHGDAFAHVTDLAPTLLELAGVEHPSTYSGRDVLPLRGVSMLPLLRGERSLVHEEVALGWEWIAQRAFIQGDYKALLLPPPFGAGEWQLFNLATDPGEVNDLAASEPERLLDLISRYDEYATEVGVVAPDLEELYRRTGMTADAEGDRE